MARAGVGAAVAFAIGVTGVGAAAAAAPSSVLPPTDDVATTGTSESSLEQVLVVVPPVDETGEPVPTPTPEATDADHEVVAGIEDAEKVSTPVVETDDFALVGLTWPDEADVSGLDGEIRVRTEDGWSEWMPVEPADGGPDAGTADAASAVRGGSEPIWVENADAVQARFASTAEGGPEELKVELVQPGDDPGSVVTSATSGGAVVRTAAYRTSSSTAAAVLPAATSRPTIVSRAEWGADESLRTYNAGCGTPDYSSTLVAAVVHHTATGNAYSSPAEARAVMRSMYAYHVKSRGWCDFGYNFVVDRWGYIYEGRAGGVDRPVKGVHTGGFNTNTVGVSMLGTFDAVGPSAEQISAAGTIIAWRLGAYGRSPQGQVTYQTGGGENSRYPAGSVVTLPVVFGHRDTAYTACPGNLGYAALPAIRDRAARMTSSTPLITALYQDLLGRDPDPSGLSTWSAQLQIGVSQGALVGALTSSDEYIDKRITEAYRTILGREPDAGGALHWHNAVRGGAVAVDDVMRYFMLSDEMYWRGGGTDKGFIDALYRQVLGRAAADSEQALWAQQMPTGGREAPVAGIWNARESAQRRAAVYYRTLLGREPDAGGLAVWTTVLMQHGEGAVRIGIAGSQEYLERALSRY